MSDFPNGIYVFYGASGSDEGQKLGELMIEDDSIKYKNKHEEKHMGDIFPPGKIGDHTRSQLHKYLHRNHGYCHLELEDSTKS